MTVSSIFRDGIGRSGADHRVVRPVTAQKPLLLTEVFPLPIRQKRTQAANVVPQGLKKMLKNFPGLESQIPRARYHAECEVKMR